MKSNCHYLTNPITKEQITQGDYVVIDDEPERVHRVDDFSEESIKLFQRKGEKVTWRHITRVKEGVRSPGFGHQTIGRS